MRHKNYFTSLLAFIFAALPLSGSANVVSASANVKQSSLGATLLVNEVVDADNVFLFEERQNFILSNDVLVNFAGPGDYDNFLRNEPATIQINRGAVASSYLLHFDTPGSSSASLLVSLTFSAPIMGIITSTPDLLATDSTLGIASVQYESTRFGRGLEGIDVSVPSIIDSVHISDDLLTITANLGVTDGLDNIRILTAGVRTVPEPPIMFLLTVLAALGLQQRRKVRRLHR